MLLSSLIICLTLLFIPSWAQGVIPYTPPKCSSCNTEKQCLQQCNCMWCLNQTDSKMISKDKGFCHDIPDSSSNWSVSHDSQATIDFETSSLEDEYANQTCRTNFKSKGCHRYDKSLGIIAIIVFVIIDIGGVIIAIIILITIIYGIFSCCCHDCSDGCRDICECIYEKCCLLKPCCDNEYTEI